MNPWLSFLMGGIATCVCVGASVGWSLAVIANDPKLSLAAVAAVLRGFARRFTDLHVVVVANGAKVFVPFEQIATAIERAEMVSDVRGQAEPAPDGSLDRPIPGMEN